MAHENRILRAGAALLLLPAFLSFARQAPGGEATYEELLPAKTIVYVHLRNVSATIERFKKTPAHAFFQEDAVKKFLEKPKGKLTEKLKELEAEIGINAEEIAGFFVGQVTIAMVKTPVPAEAEAKDPHLVLLADVGDNGKALMDRIDKAMEKAPAGAFDKFKEDAQGIGYTLLKFKGEGPTGALAYCLTGRNFIVASGQKTMVEILTATKARSAENLAGSPVFKEAVERAGEKHDFLVFVNLKRLIEDLKELAPQPEPGQPSVDQVLKGLGLDALSWAAIGLTIGEKAMISNWYLKAPGEKRGLLKMVSPGAGELKLPDSIPEDAATFAAFRFRASAFLDELREALNAANPQFAAQLDGLLGLAQMQAQVDVKKELLGTIGDTHYFYVTYPKPFKFGGENQVFVFGLKDKDALSTAINKMLTATGNTAFEEKEYLGYKFRTLKMPGGQDPNPAGIEPPAITFGVIGDQFVLAMRLEGMQDFLRRLGKPGGFRPNEDPTVREVLSALPKNRVVVAYQDGKKVADALINQLKSPQFGMILTMAGINLDEYVDMNLLPDAELVKKYSGVSVGVVAATDDGYVITQHAPYPTK